MIPIKGGVTKVTHVNKPKTDKYTDAISSKPVKHYDCDLSGDATNSIKGTSPFGAGKRHGLFGKKTQSRNQ